MSVIVTVLTKGDPKQVEEYAAANAESMQAYLDKYFGEMRMSVYWGTAREFCQELLTRWQQAYPPD